jgi:hypothetical protein
VLLPGSQIYADNIRKAWFRMNTFSTIPVILNLVMDVKVGGDGGPVAAVLWEETCSSGIWSFMRISSNACSSCLDDQILVAR